MPKYVAYVKTKWNPNEKLCVITTRGHDKDSIKDWLIMNEPDVLLVNDVEPAIDTVFNVDEMIQIDASSEL